MYSVYNYKDFKFLADEQMGKRMEEGWYESEEISLLGLIPGIEDSSVLELGGCLGVVSVITNSKLKNKQKHVVIEANPNLIPYIENNKCINDSCFEIEHAMISTKSDGTFYSYDKLVAGSAHRMDSRETNKTKHIVNVMTYQDIEAKYNTIFDVLIIDIEGGELEFLKEIVDVKTIKYVMIELHEQQMFKGFNNQCFDALKNLGLHKIASRNNSFLYGV